MRDVDANEEVCNLVLGLLVAIPYSLRMRPVQLDEVGWWVLGLFADHVIEGLGVSRVVGEVSADLCAVDIVGGKRKRRWRAISTSAMVSCPKSRETYQYQDMREEAGVAGN